eukprot:TRINITY_DN10030_c1_g1_i8.p1 TRINITY_DN10030_c1_g1~~TRINITY_DN10030_c1_g1_i8.p1  ORF type:complete len:186 (-),score=24.60 TRINITY_DN10030_c1_g1_i8:20-541(-)
MIAQENNVKYVLRKLLPTVGCEADAIAFIDEEKHILASTTQEGNKTILPNGSYSSCPERISSEEKKVVFEQCLYTSDKTRVRFFHTLTRRDSESDWRLINIEVVKEVFDQPYHGRQELGGCGGGQPRFSDKERLNLDDLQKEGWKVKGAGEQGMGFEFDNGLPSLRSIAGFRG